MSSNTSITKVKMEADATGLGKIFGKINKDTARFVNSQVTSIRRLAQVGISMSSMFGTFIDQTYALGIEAGLLSIELATSLLALEAGATMGASLIFKAGAQASAIVSMVVTILNLRAGRTRATQQSQGAVAAFRLMSF